MGMHTELYISCQVKKDIPDNVKSILYCLFTHGCRYCRTDSFPDHPFFYCNRWEYVGKGNSFYFTPFSTSKIMELPNGIYITSRSDLKNYDNEIEHFFDWISPYLDMEESSHVGHIRYEEHMAPTLLFFCKNKIVKMSTLAKSLNETLLNSCNQE